MSRSDSLRKLHNWMEQPTGYMFADRNEPEMLASLHTAERPLYPDGLGIMKEHRWTVLLNQTFRCNDAQYNLASQNAAQTLMHYIYGPIEQEVRQAMSATYGGDRNAAMAALARILELIER